MSNVRHGDCRHGRGASSARPLSVPRNIGREILDSRGNPTGEVDVVLEDGA